MSLLNRELFLKLKQADFQTVSAVENAVLEHYKISRENLSDDQHKILEKYLGDFKKLAKKKWKEVNSSLAKLDHKHSTWLQSCVEVPDLVASKSKSTSGGRPAKEFEELSTRSRDRVTAPLREQNTGEKLLHASMMNLREEGKTGLVHLINDANQSPTRPAKF